MSFRIGLSRAFFIATLFIVLDSVGADGATATATYTYDQLGRVTTVLYDNGTCVAYSYDATGNRTAQINTRSSTPELLTWGSGVWGCFPWTPH